jgi:hypothetical protein
MWMADMVGPCGANGGDEEVRSVAYVEIGELDHRSAMAVVVVVHDDGVRIAKQGVVGAWATLGRWADEWHMSKGRITDNKLPVSDERITDGDGR